MEPALPLLLTMITGLMAFTVLAFDHLSLFGLVIRLFARIARLGIRSGLLLTGLLFLGVVNLSIGVQNIGFVLLLVWLSPR